MTLENNKLKVLDLCCLFDDLKKHIDEESGSLTVTVATNDFSDWDYQIGDNSYSGSVYRFSHWAVVDLYENSNCLTLAVEAINQLKELI